MNKYSGFVVFCLVLLFPSTALACIGLECANKVEIRHSANGKLLSQLPNLTKGKTNVIKFQVLNAETADKFQIQIGESDKFDLNVQHEYELKIVEDIPSDKKSDCTIAPSSSCNYLKSSDFGIDGSINYSLYSRVYDVSGSAAEQAAKFKFYKEHFKDYILPSGTHIVDTKQNEIYVEVNKAIDKINTTYPSLAVKFKKHDVGKTDVTLFKAWEEFIKKLKNDKSKADELIEELKTDKEIIAKTAANISAPQNYQT